MTDADIRRLLDAVPVPEVAPVDVTAILHAAADRQATLARRWKVAAAGFAALAAGIAGVAFFPRPEVQQIASVEDRAGTRLAAVEAELRLFAAKADLRDRETDAARAELKDLLLIVAADVRRLETDDRLAARVRELVASLDEVKKDQTALYTLATTKFGGTP